MNNPVVCITNLSVSYHNIPALWDVNVDIYPNELTAIIGPNGAGKSTLLKAILGLIPVNGDPIKINGKTRKNIKDLFRVFAYVPQRTSVDWNFPISCLEVVLMGRYGHIGLFKRPTKKDKQFALDALEKFGMKAYADRQIGELSGGQKQRVFLARAYVQQAEIYILDEPFGGVDVKTEEITLNLFNELKSEGKTIIVVTHDLQSLQSYFDKVILLNTSLISAGTPEFVLKKGNLTEAYGGHLHMNLGVEEN